MKKTFSFLIWIIAMLASSNAVAQLTVALNAITTDTTLMLDGSQVMITDDDSLAGGGYTSGVDYHISLNGGCLEPRRMSIYVTELSVGCLDTVYIYDGPTATGTPLVKFNSFTGNVHEGDIIYESPSNSTGFITIRFVTDSLTDTNRTQLACHANNTEVNTGFKLLVQCRSTCATVTPVIDDKFYRTRNGEIYDSGYVHEIIIYDTIYNIPGDPTSGVASLQEIDRFLGANLCIGDGSIFLGHGEYSNLNAYYTPTDSTSYFRWDMDNEDDTIVGYGVTQIVYGEYQRTGCYDIRLTIVDEMGCTSGVVPSIRVRTAMNPIKTLYTLDDICSRDSLMVNVGHDGENATLTLARIQSDSSASKTFTQRTFIPDGASGECGDYFFEAPVTFEEFSSGQKVTMAADICSICINMEHSYMSDIFITIICPNNKEAVLKYGRTGTGIPVPPFLDPTAPIKTSEPGGETGGSVRLGYPLTIGTTPNLATGGDNMTNVCDSTENPYGIGLDYCFSRDTAYLLVTGDRAGDVWDDLNQHPAGNFYIGASGAPTVNNVVNFPPIPAGFAEAGTTPKADNNKITTRRPSNYADKKDYYLPYSTFDELVGCDLNGEWKIRVYDVKKNDNGWIFSWTMDICNSRAGSCDYQVGIDSLVWEPDPDPQYHDYYMGNYRGVAVYQAQPTVSYIYTPDTAGTFPVLVHVYDEFGCQWDTNTTITSIWSPQPNLGPDTALCGITQITLDANDSHSKSPTEHYSYAWSPFGQDTDTITTAEDPGTTITYEVQVTNTQPRKQCETRDTIVIANRRQPLPSVLPSPFVFEGCDPFTLSFDNQSIDADEHLWLFGDGVTSTERSPSHTYVTGTYDLRYYATSADGCMDSIISPGAVKVYPSPKAAFSWTPTYPSVTHPTVQMNNETENRTPQTRYFWEMQYSLDNPFSVETLTEENPTFDFTQYSSGNPAGNYAVKLIARADNIAPSGNLIQCIDTADNNILVVNDFLQFPNVVTPNGDGINDRFEIKNLLDGLAYPINALYIYNKWGTLVYHVENINSEEDYWDPSDVPTGTYYFRFTARGFNGRIERNGTIEVIR